MKRLMSVTMVLALVALVAGAALAYGPRGPMGPYGYGPMMGAGWQGGPMGPGRMGGWAGGGCPGWSAAQGQAGETPEAITEEKAQELATEYTSKYLKGFAVERVLPFAMRAGTMYQVELKGPKGEKRILHVNPWGQVRPFGPLAAADE